MSLSRRDAAKVQSLMATTAEWLTASQWRRIAVEQYSIADDIACDLEDGLEFTIDVRGELDFRNTAGRVCDQMAMFLDILD